MKRPLNSLSAETIREILSYDPANGYFRWKLRPVEMFRDGGHSAIHNARKWNSRYAHKIAGLLGPDGYWVVRIFGKNYQAHRLAWLYMTDAWPADVVDHIDRDKQNNRFDNLREATKSQNGANSGNWSTNSSGEKGVCWDRSRMKWLATIMVQKRHIHLGRFEHLKDACLAYKTASLKYFGAFANSA